MAISRRPPFIAIRLIVSGNQESLTINPTNKSKPQLLTCSKRQAAREQTCRNIRWIVRGHSTNKIRTGTVWRDFYQQIYEEHPQGVCLPLPSLPSSDFDAVRPNTYRPKSFFLVQTIFCLGFSIKLSQFCIDWRFPAASGTPAFALDDLYFERMRRQLNKEHYARILEQRVLACQ